MSYVWWHNDDGSCGVGFPVKGDEMYEVYQAPTETEACTWTCWLNGGIQPIDSFSGQLPRGRGREKIPDLPPEEPVA